MGGGLEPPTVRRTRAELVCCATETTNLSHPWTYFFQLFCLKLLQNIQTAATIYEHCLSSWPYTSVLRYWDRYASWCSFVQVTFRGMHTYHGKCRHDAANLQNSSTSSDKWTQAEISVYNCSVYNPNTDKQQLLQKLCCISAPAYCEHWGGKLCGNLYKEGHSCQSNAATFKTRSVTVPSNTITFHLQTATCVGTPKHAVEWQQRKAVLLDGWFWNVL